MNLDRLQSKLIAAARSYPPDDGVPYAFEKRIMARLAAPAADSWGLWARGFRSAALACVAVAVLAGSWSFQDVSDTREDLSQDFENVVLAGLNLDEENW